MLRSDLCGYNDAYIVGKGRLDLLALAAYENDQSQKNVTFANNTQFASCILRINGTLIDHAENLDIVMPIYNLLKYSQNFSMTSGSLWNYYRDENDDVNGNASDGKSFVYKTKILGKTPQSPERPPRLRSNPDGSQPPNLPNHQYQL